MAFSDANVAAALAAVPDLPMPDAPTNATGSGLSTATDASPNATENKVAEVKAAEPKVEEVKAPADEKTAKRFADLSKKDQQQRQKETEWKAQVAAKEAELTAKLEKVTQYEALVGEAISKKDFKKLFDSIGVTYEDLAEAKITGKFRPETEAKHDPTQKKLLELEQKIEAEKKERADKEAKAQQRAEEQAVQTYKAAVAEEFTTYKDAYEFLAAELTPAQVADAVHQAAVAFYEQTKGKVDLPTRAKFLEAMEKDAETRAENLSKTKKWSTKFGATKVVEKVVEVPAKKVSALSSALAGNEAQPKDRPETEEERFRRAVKAMEST